MPELLSKLIADCSKVISNFYDRHYEIILAIVFAIVVGAIIDFFRADSPFRVAVRHIKNRLAEKSIERLRKRINELERYRDKLPLYLSFERALYMHMLGFVVFVLISICLAGAVLMLGSPSDTETQRAGALGIFLIGSIVGVYGLRLASFDTRGKISELIEKLNGEILELKTKLNSRTRTS